MRARLVMVLGCLLAGGVAHAQPDDPYAPGASGEDPVLAEQIAAQVVQRAQQLYDARQYADARKLAREALAESPTGAAGKQATYIIRAVDGLIGKEKAPPPSPPSPPPPPPAPQAPTSGANTSFGPSTTPAPTGEPAVGPVTPPRDPNAIPDIGDYGPGVTPPPISATPPPGAPLPPLNLSDKPSPPTPHRRHEQLAAGIHGGLYAGLLGATIGSFFSTEAAAGAVPLGVAMGLGGFLAAPRLTAKLHWSAAQLRTAGSLSTWGGVVGGLFGDIAQTENTSASDVLVGATIGSTVGLAIGAGLAKSDRFTSGDIALVDTLAGAGTLGGLTLGMLMQPAQNEAYSLNAVFGAVGGVIVGLIAAPRTNTTPRRMVRVATYTVAGGALPFLLYGAIRDASTTGDERVIGLLSTGGLVAGLWLGFHQTRHFEVGQDVKHRAATATDAPAALLGRSSDGTWALGGLGITPLSPRLAPQHGLALTLVSGSL